MTATYPGEPGARAAGSEPNPLVRATLALERATLLDPVTRLVAPLAEAVAGPAPRREALQGRWLGHALHPVLVMVPLGTWAGVTVLDLVGGSGGRSAARTLTGFGVVAALPAVATGWAEWVGANDRDRRTATVHAVSNAVGLSCYARSYLARRRGRHGRGALAAAAGLAATSVGGYLGSHLAQVRKVGSHHPAYAAED